LVRLLLHSLIAHPWEGLAEKSQNGDIFIAEVCYIEFEGESVAEMTLVEDCPYLANGHFLSWQVFKTLELARRHAGQ
jgi:hypothetical protein